MFHVMERVGIPLEMRCHLWRGLECPWSSSSVELSIQEIYLREFGSLENSGSGEFLFLTAQEGENLRNGHHEEQHIPNPAPEEGWEAGGANPGQNAK